MKLPNEIKKTNVPLYTNEFYISVNEEVICSYMKLEPVGGEGWSALLDGAIYMYLKPNSEPSIICHEAFHAAMLLCKQLNIKVDENNDEAAAYLAEWFFGAASEFVNAKR